MKYALILLAIIMTGCAQGPTKEQLANADYGNYPDNYEEIAKAHILRQLKDPDSVKFGYISRPIKKMAKMGAYGEPKFGYLVCISYNAKNSFGGYAGFSVDALIIRNSWVVMEPYASDRYCG